MLFTKCLQIIYICIFRQHFFVNANFIKHNRHFMPTYSLLDPFEFPYYFYRIWGELIKVLSIVVCIPSTFCPTLGHHQGRICYKSDVTFVLANYYCVRTSLLLEIMALAYEKFSPTTQQYSNIKIINKNFRFSKHYILETCNQHLIELIFKPVLTYLNVFSYWHYLQNYI